MVKVLSMGSDKFCAKAENCLCMEDAQAIQIINKVCLILGG